MGAGQSTDGSGHAPSPEELSHILAERFAAKCFTPLELTHFKDNFFSRALNEGGLRYWNENILSDFLGIPDGATSHRYAGYDTPLDAGPVIFRMVSYLGAFPFQATLAPSVLSFEAMVKVVVLLTERYGRVLKRGNKDRVRLLFGSLADVGRKDFELSNMDASANGQSSTYQTTTEKSGSHVPGFSIDEPANDGDEEEDDDDLALAALESLDAIEVFKHDSRIDRAVFEARVSADTFRRLLMLLLAIAPLKTLEPVSEYTFQLSHDDMEAIRLQADSIVASFGSDEIASGIRYKTFARIASISLPNLFYPLTPLFEHLLFSRNLDLSRRQGTLEPSDSIIPSTEKPVLPPQRPPPILLPGSFESAILNPSVLSHLSFSLAISSGPNLFHSGIRLHPLFSSAAHGQSITTFSHNVLTWQSPTLLLVQGASTKDNVKDEEKSIILGAYLPQSWKQSPSSNNLTGGNDRSKLPCLFQLYPFHSIIRGNSFVSSQKATTSAIFFSASTGIAIGCEVSLPARNSFGPGITLSPAYSSKHQQQPPIPMGGGSLLIDPGFEMAELHVSSNSKGGVFLPPVPNMPTMTRMEIYNLEVWGLVADQKPSNANSETDAHDAIALQRAKWEFDARDAERRRSINLKLGGSNSEVQSARALLEMAGIAGDSGKSGGSV
ncbi:TLD domain containing protein [Elaphomyces granulatus]